MKKFSGDALYRAAAVVIYCFVGGCSSDVTTPGAATTTDAGTTGGGNTCSTPTVACSGSCVDVSGDAANCGSCGVVCSTGQVCSQGACTDSCLVGSTQCGQDCVDTATSAAHCGSCGNACGAGQTCVAGQCTDSSSTTGGTTGVATTTGGVTTGSGGTTATTGGVTTGSGGTAPGSGGTATSGGAGGDSSVASTTAGGATNVGPCNRPVGSCSAPEVSVTEIDVGVPVTGYGNEGDTAPLPMAIAAMPSGGSRLAWLGTDGNVYLGELDCNDNLVGTPGSLPGVDLQDLYADDEGGIVLLTREATNGGTDNCGGGQLCGGSSSPCRAMWMVRFDNAGNVQWETMVSNLSDSMAGYDAGARFVWWYQHHGRLAFDGTSNYAAYFCTAVTEQNGSCVDIHEGDRVQVVDTSGSLVPNHPDVTDWGCAHSWTTRIVWDPRVERFVTVCASDRNCDIEQSGAYYSGTSIAPGNCNNTLFNGDIVLAPTSGYWVAWSQDGTIRLEHFEFGQASDQTISNAGSSSHPHMVSYGTNHMLLSWGSGSGMTAQVRDATTGDTVGAEFSIDVNDHDYQAFKAYEDGSAAYPASGSNNTSINIARVMPCSG